MQFALTGVLVVVLSVCLTSYAQQPWEPDPAVVESHRNRRPERMVDESKVEPYQLPDALVMSDGRKVTTPQQWRERREEILEMFRTQMYGRSPGRPQEVAFETIEENARALDGDATLKRVSIISRHNGREHRFQLLLFLPNSKTGPAPTFLLINNRPPENIDYTREHKSEFWPVEQMIARGYGIAAFQNAELAPDNTETFREGIMRLFEEEGSERRPDGWGTLGAWAWGASRAMDYFETDVRVDEKRVAVVGHSRGGKTALWCAAQDERFAMAVSNNSGCAGAALSKRRYGETIRIINRNTHWFCPNFLEWNDREHELPFDQHMLIALIAPRAVYVTSATEDLWADPRGEFLALAHASPVYAVLGYDPIAPDPMAAPDAPIIVPPRAYHIRTGGHNMVIYDWERFADFADRLWN